MRVCARKALSRLLLPTHRLITSLSPSSNTVSAPNSPRFRIPSRLQSSPARFIDRFYPMAITVARHRNSITRAAVFFPAAYRAIPALPCSSAANISCRQHQPAHHPAPPRAKEPNEPSPIFGHLPPVPSQPANLPHRPGLARPHAASATKRHARSPGAVCRLR
jgi:hypothetical protein